MSKPQEILTISCGFFKILDMLLDPFTLLLSERQIQLV